ncbi:protein IMPAIRED IN BABA-INDUCED STERILITY 1-like [Rutidosis leptorrhynchoides]|uniref:protein IMPAIRED IN BABA-INDUCED STERILITY 1-like n=1 Tax=Rutidosis leptorrhynchoides TaxID=125765 RepID=UPI003A9A27B1
MVALKKVRFDNLKPDSVKFMAREITILRTLDHPNIMKLEGIITSQLSCDIYLVFEYMEHDLSELLSNPDIKFSDSQIKCYMRQLLKGIEHCHSLGILHRDIKTANILLNSKGILKIGDFGLAKFLRPKNREPLTSHVVTLWYRPPELLLGCTKYGAHVDLWSVGCVLAELFLGKPILKGQTEVEQLHKIFKLCGTPPDDYWNKSKLPLANMYKPHHVYESSLRERCKQLPETAVNLIETLLSIDPCKRGSARSALESEYFNTKPYACDISNLPKYPPKQDIHTKETCSSTNFRNKTGGIVWGSLKNPTRNPRTCQEQNSLCKVVPTEVNADIHTARSSSRRFVDCRGSSKALKVETSRTKEGYQSDAISALPIQATASNGSFMWAATRRKHGGIPTHNEASVLARSGSKRMSENGESTSRVWSGLKTCRLQSLNQPDSSKVHNSQDLMNDEGEVFFDARSQLTQ